MPWTGALPTEGPLALDLLVVDHAMGGGANRYRDERLAEMLGQGQTVGLLTYRLAAIAICWSCATVRAASSSPRHACPSSRS